MTPPEAPRSTGTSVALAVSVVIHGLLFAVPWSRQASAPPASRIALDIRYVRSPRVAPPPVAIPEASPPPRVTRSRPPPARTPVATPEAIPSPAPGPAPAPTEPGPVVAPVPSTSGGGTFADNGAPRRPGAVPGGRGPGPGVNLLPSLGASVRITDPTRGADGSPSARLLRDPTFKHRPFVTSVRNAVSRAWRPDHALDRALVKGELPGGVREAWLMVELDATGKVVDVVVTEPSGLPFLDEEAVKGVHAAQPFPPPPVELLSSRGTWRFPVRFKVRVVPPGHGESNVEKLLPRELRESSVYRLAKEMALPPADPLDLAITPAERRLVHPMCLRLQPDCAECVDAWGAFSAIYEPCAHPP